MQQSQSEARDKLTALHGSPEKAGQRLSKRVADELTRTAAPWSAGSATAGATR